MRALLSVLLLMAGCQSFFPSQDVDYPLHPVPFTEVEVTPGFWKERLETNRLVTLPYDFEKCRETGRIDNFAVAGGLKAGDFTGKRYNDSDVYKVIEGAAFSLHMQPDPELEAYLDSLISLIAAAQEEDGYLYTTRTIHPDDPVDTSPGRWSDLMHGHELYNVGHLYEAAVAHHQATGKRNLLDVALKNAELLLKTFGPGKKEGAPGHEEIEIGLVKLYRLTGDIRYLDLARFFLEQRGKHLPDKEPENLYQDPVYIQNHLPVVQQTEAVGHAVRAGYLYCGMADVAALTGDSAYMAALDSLWDDVVSHKMYLTGGIGARHEGEAFGEAYELPNATAYNETCAAIAHMLWNYRLFLTHGESKYLDVFERVLYNGFLSGVSLGGNSFFYANPLESDGKYAFNVGQAATRSPWFRTSCCPVNVVRFLPQLPGFVYAKKGNEVFVNLFVNSEADISLDDHSLHITQKTGYPWEGMMRWELEPAHSATFSLNLRIPCWVDNKPVPGDLYRYLHRSNRKIVLKVNGELVHPDLSNGFARIERKWEKGDVVVLELPLAVRRVLAHTAVVADSGRVALERGPVVYCAEGIDNDGAVLDLQLPSRGAFEGNYRPELLGGIIELQGKAIRDSAEVPFTAIPYYAWSHRGEGEMAVWFPLAE